MCHSCRVANESHSRLGPRRAAQPPGGARGLGYELGLLRPRTPRPSRARALRAHKAAGRAAAAGARGERAGQQPSQPPRHRNPSNSGSGTRADPQGTCPQNPEPQLGVFGIVGTFPRPFPGPVGSGPGGISARPCCAEAAGREQGVLCLSEEWEARLEGTHKSPSARGWDDAQSAVIPIPDPQLWSVGVQLAH